MQRIFIGLVVALAMTMGAMPAYAEASRYSMTPVEGGALRLDTQTGAVSLCTEKDGAWACAGVADEMAKLRERIAALEDENNVLKTELGRLRAGAGDDAKAEARGAPPPNSAPQGGEFKTPNDDEIDQMMQFMEKMARRLKGMVEDLKRDQTSPPAGEQL